jgi:hypothetical protein
LNLEAMMRLTDSELEAMMLSKSNGFRTQNNQSEMFGQRTRGRVPAPPFDISEPSESQHSSQSVTNGKHAQTAERSSEEAQSLQPTLTSDVTNHHEVETSTQEDIHTLEGVSGAEHNGNGHQVEATPSTSLEDNVESGEPERGFLPVLKNHNFLTLWSGQVFSQLADKVYLVLMIALIVSRFQEADQTISGWVSSVMIAFTIPAVLFGSIAGVFVDRWFKKPVLVATNLLRGALVLVLPPLLWISQGWSPLGPLPIGFCILLLITFLVSTLTQFLPPQNSRQFRLLWNVATCSQQIRSTPPQ